MTWAAVGTNVLQRPPREPVVAPVPGTVSHRTPSAPVTTSHTPSPSHASSRLGSPASSPSPSPSAAKPGQLDFLRSSCKIDPGSVDNWSQGDVTLVTTETATELELTVHVVTTPYLSNSGAWSTIPEAYLTTTVEQQPDALVYRFTLKPGASLGAGSYTFGVQYAHAVGGRDPSRDTYQAAATAGGKRIEVSGGFRKDG